MRNTFYFFPTRLKDTQPFGLASSSAYIILVLTRGLHHKPIKEHRSFFLEEVPKVVKRVENNPLSSNLFLDHFPGFYFLLVLLLLCCSA
jgi:hypothetical protein